MTLEFIILQKLSYFFHPCYNYAQFHINDHDFSKASIIQASEIIYH